jgi:hypothetical protein
MQHTTEQTTPRITTTFGFGNRSKDQKIAVVYNQHM